MQFFTLALERYRKFRKLPYKRSFIPPKLRPKVKGTSTIKRYLSDKDIVPLSFLLFFFIARYLITYTPFFKAKLAVDFIILLITIFYFWLYRKIFMLPKGRNKAVIAILSIIPFTLLPMYIPWGGIATNLNMNFSVVMPFLIAPIIEEYTFRYLPFIISKNEKQLFSIILFSSFIFSLFHINIQSPDTLDFLQHFWFSLSLSALFYKYRSLVLIITVHLVLNVWSLFLQ